MTWFSSRSIRRAMAWSRSCRYWICAATTAMLRITSWIVPTIQMSGDAERHGYSLPDAGEQEENSAVGRPFEPFVLRHARRSSHEKAAFTTAGNLSMMQSGMSAPPF